MDYCSQCLMPNTRPNNRLFDEQGLCDACQNFHLRDTIDWAKRKLEFLEIIARFKQRNQGQWDCVVPVSGGKDSCYQVIAMLELGLTPLCVNSGTCHLSDIGRENLDNLKALGVDLIEFAPNPVVRRALNRIGLRQVGDISWPEHVAIFTVPVRIATQFSIPLVVWGENGQNEYGGPATEAEKNLLDSRWLHEYGGMLGLRLSDVVSMDGLVHSDLHYYQYPSDEAIKRVGTSGVYLGYYLPWDGMSNALVAQAHGFKCYESIVEGSMVNYENLDNYQTGIHDYFKFLKYGFGRATDIASLHIRRGRITRNQAIDIVRKHDGKFPSSYLGKSLAEILDHIDMGMGEFVEVCDRFTNKKIFTTTRKGQLIKDEFGNLTKIDYPQKSNGVHQKQIKTSISTRVAEVRPADICRVNSINN